MTIVSGSKAQAGGTNTITLAAGDAQATGYYVGMAITITSGTGSGQNGYIVSYTNSTNIATISANWTRTD